LEDAGSAVCHGERIWPTDGGRGLVNVLAGPTEKRVELIRINHEVNDERDWGQHEYEVSHGHFPR
jgi:hypothetical protein